MIDIELHGLLKQYAKDHRTSVSHLLNEVGLQFLKLNGADMDPAVREAIEDRITKAPGRPASQGGVVELSDSEKEAWQEFLAVKKNYKLTQVEIAMAINQSVYWARDMENGKMAVSGEMIVAMKEFGEKKMELRRAKDMEVYRVTHPGVQVEAVTGDCPGGCGFLTEECRCL